MKDPSTCFNFTREQTRTRNPWHRPWDDCYNKKLIILKNNNLNLLQEILIKLFFKDYMPDDININRIFKFTSRPTGS
jgi:hypothetical protein